MKESNHRDRAELPPEPVSVPTDCMEPKRPDSGGNDRLTPSAGEKFPEHIVGDQ